MAKLIVQRTNLQAFRQKYCIYINRVQAGNIAFAEQLEIELNPGRYQLSVGGFFAREAEVWFEIGAHNIAFELDSEGISLFKNLPKYHGLKLIAKGPIQLKGKDELLRLKQAVKAVLWKQLIFNFLYAGFLVFLFGQALASKGFNALYVIGALLLLNFVAINVSLRKHLLRKAAKQSSA